MMSATPIALTVVVPVYREVESLPLLCDGFVEALPQDIEHEILFVNDGNLGNEVQVALRALANRPRVRVIHLSRNYGQHVAIAAGLKNARGDYVLVMDADLQYRPADCCRMFELARRERRPAVVSVHQRRARTPFRDLSSRLYYRLMTALGTPQRADLGSAFVVSRHVARGLSRMSDRYRVTIPMAQWLMGELSYFDMPHHPRADGRTGYTLSKLVVAALTGITAFSAKPLYVSLLLSLLFAMTGLGATLYLVTRVVLFGRSFLAGWTSTVALILVCTAAVLGCLGIMGIYLARVFDTVLGRPLYYVQEGEADGVALFEDRW